jgi:hypothetical protein
MWSLSLSLFVWEKNDIHDFLVGTTRGKGEREREREREREIEWKGGGGREGGRSGLLHLAAISARECHPSMFSIQQKPASRRCFFHTQSNAGP